MKFRKVEKDDLNFLAELFDSYRVFYKKNSDIEKAKIFLSQRLNKKDSEIFVAETLDNRLVGFVQLYPLFSSTRMKKLWLLNDLFVEPKFRNKGISIGLIEKAKQLVIETDACGMFLETEKSNFIGNKLYPKTNFVLNEGSNFYEWSNNEEMT
ncbi:MAG: GNAT family N-acetyltransferase [Lutimonas sp.]